MKIYSLFLLILFTCSISSCEDSVTTHSKPKKSPLKVTAEPRKKSKIQKQSKINSNKKPVKVEQNQQSLDLSLPFEFKQTTSITNPGKQNYLPDLFADSRNQSKSSFQVGGKIIKRIEEETDKERTADGLGIDFNLSH